MGSAFFFFVHFFGDVGVVFQSVASTGDGNGLSVTQDYSSDVEPDRNSFSLGELLFYTRWGDLDFPGSLPAATYAKALCLCK